MSEKCIPKIIEKDCKYGLVDAKCIPYTGDNLPNIGASSGERLNSILVKIDENIGGGDSSTSNIQIVSLSLSGDYTYNLTGEKWVIGVAINPTANLAAFKLGTTASGNELIYDQLVYSGGYTPFNTSYYTPGGNILYFSGITSPSTVKLLIVA